MIKFRCKTCQKKIGVKDEYAGRAIKCPGCETRLTVPKPGPQPAPVAAPEPDGMPDLAGLAALEAAAPAQMQSVEAPGRKCPACDATVSDKAVICINCGYSFQKGGKKIDTKVVRDDDSGGEKRKSSMGGAGRMALGLAVTSVVGVVCCVGWLILMLGFGVEIGLLAWAIGGIVGLTAGLIGRNPSPIYCGLTACIAGASIIGAKIVVAATMSVVVWGAGIAETIFDEFSPQRINLYHAVMEDMLTDGEFSGLEEDAARNTTEAYFGVKFVVEPETDAYWEASWDMDEKVEARLGSLSEAEQLQALDAAQARHPNWVGDPYLYQAAAARLVEQDAFEEGLENHAKQTVVYYNNLLDEQGSKEWNDDYGDWLEHDVYMEREFKVREQIGQYVATLNPAQRDELIAQTKAANPHWMSSEDEAFGEANAELDQLQAEIEAEGLSSDFGHNLFLTLGMFDLIFLALAIGTAYSVAYAKGA